MHTWVERLLQVGVLEGHRHQTDVVNWIGWVGLHNAHAHPVPVPLGRSESVGRLYFSGVCDWEEASLSGLIMNEGQ